MLASDATKASTVAPVVGPVTNLNACLAKCVETKCTHVSYTPGTDFVAGVKAVAADAAKKIEEVKEVKEVAGTNVCNMYTDKAGLKGDAKAGSKDVCYAYAPAGSSTVWWIVGILVLIAIGVGIYFYMKKKDEQ